MTMRDERPDWLSPPADQREPSSQHAGDDESRNLTDIIELMFFAYRDFTGEADERLADQGFGRAHHRVLYFVSRHPGLSVTDLLAILRITKQSLARVLKRLIDEGYVSQRSGDTDKRQRLLYPTEKGTALADTLTQLQIARVSGALGTLNEKDRVLVRNFLFGMISTDEQPAVEALMKREKGPC